MKYSFRHGSAVFCAGWNRGYGSAVSLPDDIEDTAVPSPYPMT